LARYGYDYGYGYGGWAPYVPVAERRRRAMKKMEALRKKGMDVQPVQIDGRKIAKSFWGTAWCEHLESFSDYENRLPRGRTYVRNGSVCHLEMAKGRVEAKVSGSELYNVRVTIKPLPNTKWTSLKGRCSGQIGSLLELLQGRRSDRVMEVVTHRKEGLFPLPGEMSFTCSCPDSARMCKHVAAVLYGVGARLDNKPELLFVLRGVDHEELIAADVEKAVTAATSQGKSKRLAESELGEVFGIDVSPEAASMLAPKSSNSDTADSPTKTLADRKRTKRQTAAAVTRRGRPKVATPRCKVAVKKRTTAAPLTRGAVVKQAKSTKKVAAIDAKDKARTCKRKSLPPKTGRSDSRPSASMTDAQPTESTTPVAPEKAPVRNGRRAKAC